MQFEQIVDGSIAGSLSLDGACHELVRESQADPGRTRFWGQRVESEMKRGRITTAAARSMLDALEGFQCDKTMWLDPGVGLVRGGPAANAAANAAQPVAADISSAEQLRATLFRPITRPLADFMPPALRDATHANVEWLEGAVNAATTPACASNLEAMPLGSVIKGRYRLVAHLGAGGIGQVFDAIDLQQPDEAHVTLKFVAVNLQHEPYAFDALEAAVRTSERLDHPNIAKVYDIDRDENRVFIAMEPLNGRWLSGIVREARNLGMSYDAAWPIISGIAQGLAHAHDQGVVHSDLSPHAIFVCSDGQPKIMGFGLVHAVPASNESLDVLDTLTLRAYTEAYTADAWAQQGRPHPADDLYPLGVIAYEMLTGKHPFQRCALSVARQKGLKCPPIAGLGRRASQLIERCMSFERGVRPQDGTTFLKHMRPGFFDRVRVAAGVSA